MAVTDDQIATLRAHLAGDVEEHERLYARLGPAAGTGYNALVAAAFCTAVERRFAKDGTTADVVEFVGDVRARSERLSEAIDPHTAERVIRAVYTDELVDDVDDKTMGGTQIVLLTALIADAHLDDAGLDEFMAAARGLADQWLS